MVCVFTIEASPKL